MPCYRSPEVARPGRLLEPGRQADRLRVEPRDAVPDPRGSGRVPGAQGCPRCGPLSLLLWARSASAANEIQTGTRQPSARRVLLIQFSRPGPRRILVIRGKGHG